ncbi:MAG: hypothetical protein QG604_103 [Candidatus Dependentiae bacterium]|nr:hypothetical protein [Candidatus Dependentiae bacterium]
MKKVLVFCMGLLGINGLIAADASGKKSDKAVLCAIKELPSSALNNFFGEKHFEGCVGLELSIVNQRAFPVCFRPNDLFTYGQSIERALGTRYYRRRPGALGLSLAIMYSLAVGTDFCQLVRVFRPIITPGPGTPAADVIADKITLNKDLMEFTIPATSTFKSWLLVSTDVATTIFGIAGQDRHIDWALEKC